MIKRWKAARDRSKLFYRDHQPFILLCLLFVSTRILAVLFLLPGGFFGPYLPDTTHHWNQGRWSAAGAYPFFDYWLEYPPIFPWLIVLAYRASLLLPPWREAAAWFNLAYHVLLVPFEAGCLVLVYALARRLYDAAGGLRCATIYAISFVPLFVFLGFLDPLSLFFLLLGLYALLRGWPAWVGAATGLGIMCKLVPMVNLPAAWRRLRTRAGRLALVLSTVSVLLMLGLPMLAVNPQMTLTSVRAIFSRESYESVWAILEGYHGYGQVSYSRFDPSAAEWRVHPSSLPAGWITLGFGVLFVILYLAWRRLESPRRTVAFVGLTLTWLMLWSKGFSPQWMLYQIPFVVLLIPGLRGVAYLIAVDIITMSEWVLSYNWMGAHTWFLDTEVILHTALILGLGAEYAAVALWKAGRWTKIVRRGSLVLLVLTSLAQGGLLVRGVGAYLQDHADNEPHAALVEEIRAQAGKGTGVVFPQLSILERLYPLMGGIDLLWAANLGEGVDAWQSPQLVEFAGAHPDLRLVTDLGGPEPERGLEIERWLSGQYGKESTQWAGSAQVARFVTDCPVDVPARRVRFGEGILLEGAGASGGPEYGFCVRLDWSSELDLDEDYVVFVHLVDDAGHLLAQNDQPPGGGLAPTSQWAVGSQVRDLHGVVVDEPLPQGHYRFLVGMYQAEDGARLDVVDEFGEKTGDWVALADLLVQDGRCEIQPLQEARP